MKLAEGYGDFIVYTLFDRFRQSQITSVRVFTKIDDCEQQTENDV
jgi:hypothetical protein